MMTFADFHFFSETLGIQTAMYVLIPQRTAARRLITDRKGRMPTLFLLHGISDDHTIWLRRTSIETYADKNGIAVVMPSAGRSFYQDMAFGARYWTFISEELPKIARATFPLSYERKYNFVAGLSMGGYGAYRLALSKPESFAAAASLSGALDIEARFKAIQKNGSAFKAEFDAVFGKRKIKGTDSDLFHLLEKRVSEKASLPRLYQYCGRQDFLYQDNALFRSHLLKNKIDSKYVEDDGTHSWLYWDAQIKLVLEWFMGNSAKENKQAQPVLY